MRDSSNVIKINRFIQVLPRHITLATNIYFTGGATAVLKDVRETTIDVDIRFEPEHDEVFLAIQQLKEALNMNIELVSPFDFIPELPNWRERCVFVCKVGKVHYFHLDPYAQIIAKILRGFDRDEEDAKGFYKVFHCNSAKLLSLFENIKNAFIKRPSIDVVALEARLVKFVEQMKKAND